MAEAARPELLAPAGCWESLKAAAATRPAQILICGSLYLAGDVLAANGEIPV